MITIASIYAATSTPPPAGLGIFMLIFCLSPGIYCIVNPRHASRFSRSRRIAREVEPDELTISMTRVGGVIIILMGIGFAIFFFAASQ